MEGHYTAACKIADISRDFPYSCRYRLQDAPLKYSISRRGILKPLVAAREKGSLKLISGHRRFWAACELDLKEIPVFELKKEATPDELYLLSVLSNWNQAWNDLDRAWTLSRAVANKAGEKEILEEIMPALGLEGNRKIFQEYSGIAGLDGALLDLIADGHMPFRGSKILECFSREDQNVFATRIAPRAALTTNQLIQAGEWLRDLLKISGKSLAAWLDASELELILAHTSADRRQKGARLCEALRTLRFSAQAQRQKGFEAAGRAIHEGLPDLSVEAPANFEADGLVLKARLRNAASLEKLLTEIRSKRNLINDLFDML